MKPDLEGLPLHQINSAWQCAAAPKQLTWAFPTRACAVVCLQCSAFLEWLQNADEDSSDEDSDESS